MGTSRHRTPPAPVSPGPEGARTADHGTKKISKMTFGFKYEIRNFLRGLTDGYQVSGAVARSGFRTARIIRPFSILGDREERHDKAGTLTGHAGTKCFGPSFDEAQPSPAVHNGACRG